MNLTRLHKANLNKLCILTFCHNIKPLYVSEAKQMRMYTCLKARIDTVTQMNQMKDSRMFEIELEKNNVKLKAADRRQLK